MKCLYCPDFRPDPSNSSLGYCSIDMTPGSINGLNETNCSNHPGNRKMSDKIVKNNKLEVIKG